MRYSLAAFGLLGLAAAAPQMINIDAALAVPTPTILGPKIAETKPPAISYNPTAAASAVAAVVKDEGVLEKRDYYIHNVTSAPFITESSSSNKKRNACDAQPLGNGPTVTPDNAAAFSSNAEISGIARAAGTPSDYTQSFVDQAGSSQQIGYLTYRALTTYDVQGCADACDSEKYCRGFNIYFERDPSLEPGSDCPKPTSTTNIKCSLYGYPVALNAATNTGQWRQDFQVVIAGSNGYSKTDKPLPTVDGFKTPTSLPAAINAPLDNGYDTYNGMRLFNDNPFDPSLCAAACEAQTEYDMTHPDSDGTYKPCNFFVTYILTKNGVPLGTYCSLYTRSWDSSYATNTGYYYGDDKYEVVDAGSYEITTPSTSPSPSPSPSLSPSPSPSPSASPVAVSPTCGTTGTRLGFPCGSGSVSVQGVVQVLDAATSAVLGYLNHDPSQSGGYMYNVDSLANALVVKATYKSPDCAATTVSDLALEMQNAQSTTAGAYIGLVGGSGGYSKMGSGHVDYAYTGQVSFVGPDMAAQNVPTGATQLGYSGPAEASIWNLDVACGSLTATWTNNDQSQITTVMFLDYSLCSSGCILQGGDQAKFTSRYPGESLRAVTTKFVPKSS